MAGTINFESSWKKKEYREQKAQYREEYIDKLKAQHEKAERKKEQARLRGEDTWMLPSVSERITQEQQDLESAVQAKKKKEKKHKKEKKRKKKKNRSDSDSDGGPQWAEVSAAPSQKPVAATVKGPQLEPGALKGPQLEPGALKGPQLERDSWMIQPESSDFDFLPSITKNQFNEDRKKAKHNEEDEKEKMLLETPGQHELELNPFWRDGGSGLPEEEGASKKSGSKRAFTAQAVAGDGGAGWWRKAYQRCVELAEQDGRTLEDVAAERYGSLKKLETLMKGAEKSAVKSRQIERSQRDRDRYSDPRGRDNDPRARGRGEHSDRGRSERDRPKPMFKKPSSDDDERSQESRHRDKRGSPPAWKRKGFRKPGEDDESSTERKRTFMRPGEDRSPEIDRKRTFMKPGDDSDRHSSYKSRSSRDVYVPRWKKQDSSGSRRSRSRSRERRDERSRSRERSSRSDRRSRSRSRERSSRSDRRSRSRERTDRDRRSRSREQTNRDRRSRSGSRERGRRSRSGSRDRDRSKQIRHASLERRKRPVSPSSESAISDSSPSSSDSESDQEMAPQQPPAPPPKVLTETELNALGAKMVRAEIMGDEELAASLKAQITAARAAREQQPVTMVTTRRPGREEEGDMDVVLTRTDRSGNVRPLPSREHDTTGKRRGKKQKVKTHSDAGTRERYFHDDDNKDLKTLVQQERLGTAEDSNIEFLKLAAKSFKGTNPDDADEVFVDGAAQHKSAATIELKDRAKAIAEHKKTAAAMERCSFCFDKVPKHLIIAIGLKVYLCLPNHRSMTEGHCLIVPMQHTTQSTVLDEDVYEEIQVYRRALVKLYASQDQDCVFMETSMQLYKQRHMAIECVPLDRELGDMAPIYFKKAMQEAGPEWAQNKKVVDLSKKNIKNAVPKGFPYFAVDFGLQGGFAHVIEDDKTFPFYFGREIVGGMMDLEPTLWRKPHKESFEDQRKKVLQFAEWWKPFDWTQKVKQAMMDSD